MIKNLPQCRIPGFNPWVGKIPWRRKRLPTPVFWPGEFHDLYSPWGLKDSDTTEQFSPLLYYIYRKTFMCMVTTAILTIVKTRSNQEVLQ